MKDSRKSIYIVLGILRIEIKSIKYPLFRSTKLLFCKGLQVTSGQQQLGSIQRDGVTIPIRLPIRSSIPQNQQPQTSYIQVTTQL